MRMKLLVAVVAALLTVSAIAAPSVGDHPPQFRLQDQNGNWHTLDDYQGKWLVLYFYPKDDTPGCTTEACSFRDDIFKFRKMNVSIVGVSIDDVKSHAEFAEKYHLPFPLLADTDKSVTRSYGVLRSFGPIKLASRETFIIDPKGHIAHHYQDVDPDTHSLQVQDDLARLMSDT